jgi:hypothetical protein
MSSWISFLISTDILSGDYFSALRAMGFRPFSSPHSNDKMIYPDTRTRATLTIAAVAFLCIVAADPATDHVCFTVRLSRQSREASLVIED